MKAKKMFFGITGIALGVCILFMAGCKKDQSSNSGTPPAGTQNVAIRLTDGPGFFNSVNLDVKSLEVLVDTSANTRRHDDDDWDRIGNFGQRPDSSLIWKTLTINPGVYNILALSNGVDTLLTNSNIPKGTIRLIRIDLGTKNTVMKDSVTYPLTIPAGVNPYILVKLKGGEWDNYATNQYQLWLDFDVMHSIIQLNATTFYLRPVVNFYILKNTGSISGTVLPVGAKSVVTVYSPGDTAYAIPGRSGNFKVRGLQNGTYSALFHSYNGYKDSTVNNIVVSNSGNANIGTITLHQ